MAEIPTAVTAKSVERFLNIIPSSGIPSKVDSKYLKSVGFRSGNDVSLIGVFKLLGFIDTSGVPTKTWNDYRDRSKSKKILGAAIKSTYADLFAIYPDAHRKDDEAVRNWMRTATTAGDKTIQRAMATFKALVAQAEFDHTDVSVSQPTASTEPSIPLASQASSAPVMPQFGRSNPAVNINIELQVPATNDPKVYDNFFAAMKKHLFDDGGQS